MNASKTNGGQATNKIKPWHTKSRKTFVKPYLFTQSNDQISNISSLSKSRVSVASSYPEIEELTGIYINHEYVGAEQAERLASTGRDTPSFVKATTSKPPVSIATTRDHLTAYFQSIEETVRSLPAHIQIRLKTQISQLVHNAELEVINATHFVPPAT